MDRIARTDLYMQTAELFARRGTCKRAQVGAVIVREGRIVATGYNGAPPGMPHCLDVECDEEHGGCTRAIHAEANSIAFAARYGVPIEHGAMYCTHAMCRACAQLCVSAGIQTVTYAKTYRDPSGLELLQEAGLVVLKYGSV